MILTSANTWQLKNPKNTDEWLERLPHQDMFARSKAKDTALVAGWGAGKSVAALGFIDESAFANPGCTGIVMQPTVRMLKEFIETQFRPAFQHLIVSEAKMEQTITLRGDRRVVFLSGHVPERLEMYNAAWALADEFMMLKEAIFVRMTARVRVENAAWLRVGYTGTPHIGWGKEIFEGKANEKRRIIHAKTSDNPYLHPDFIEDLIANCPARMVDAYLNGLFVAKGGTVYPEYVEAKHRTGMYTDFRHITIPAIDWSPRAPHCLLVTMLDEGTKVNGNTLYKLHPSHRWAGMCVVGEIIPEGLGDGAISTKDLGRLIKGNAIGYNTLEYVCDPAGQGAEMTSGLNNVIIMNSELGLTAKYSKRPSERLITNGVDIVKWLLEPQRDKIPRLYIHNDVYEYAASLPKHLRNRSIVNAINSYGYPEIKEGRQVDSNPHKDGVTDHSMDCLRYIAVNYFPSARLTVRNRKSQ